MVPGGTSSMFAAAATSWPLATAARARTGGISARSVHEPPVSMLNSSSGRASDIGTSTFSTGTSISSAMTIAIAVVMPVPTSVRGSSKRTLPFSSTSRRMRLNVGR
jgi:hypothetical protein